MERVTGSTLLLSLVVLTHANLPPTFNDVVYDVCEDIPIGQPAFTINATDPEGQPLTYSISGPSASFFTLDRNTGVATVNKPLDKEDGDGVLDLTATVSDGVNNMQEDLTLILGNANDNRPIFVSPSYVIEIPENTAVGTSLFKVEAQDGDKFGSAGTVQYSIDQVTPDDGESLFSIVSTTGEVRLAGALNYNTLSNFYRLKINGSDGGGQCYSSERVYFSSVVYSFIDVKDVPDLDPQFLNIPYSTEVDENAPNGLSVFKVIALDQDTGVDDTISYTIEDQVPPGLFWMSGTNGTIYVSSVIDREVVGDTLNLTVKATESKPNVHGAEASVFTNVLITVKDVNDNPPRFYKCDVSCAVATEFMVEVTENTQGSISFNMTVRDLDRVSSTALTLEGADKDVFSVAPGQTTQESEVQLVVKTSQVLDFEQTPQMVVQVIATDKDQPSLRSTATVTIKIKDANDNIPRFEDGVNRLSIPEHSNVGTIIATITATDPDTMDQGELTYRLTDSTVFDVGERTGVIVVMNQTLLDREVRSSHSITLQALDTAGQIGSTVLEITVTDINDWHPVFNRDSYVVFVDEGSPCEVKIEATDNDEPDTNNSQIVYGIVEGSNSNNFTIDPATGVLKNSGELDREAINPELNGVIELTVTATDKGSPPLSTSATVVINIGDINDNSPQFTASSYNFSVKESEKGALVGSVYAEDLDQTSGFNRISFSIVNGSFGSFIIRTSAEGRGYRGAISVDPDIELDYESVRNQFSLGVEATDLEQRKSFVMADVHVLDVNDEKPEFLPIAPVTVKENTTVSGAVGRFSGTDKDGNHSLVYELESVKCRCNASLVPCDWFVLDLATGEVRVNQDSTVDYEQCDQAVMEALVVDEYTEKGDNHSAATGQMVINIEDINDNAPEFIPSDSVFVVVSETASKGTSAASITATDRDTGVHGQIDFKVTTVQFKDNNNKTTAMRMLFEAVTTQQRDLYVGIIQTTEGLDISLKGKYVVTISATDTGGLSRSKALEIFTVDESYKVELQFARTVAEVDQNLDEIIRALTSATLAAVQVVTIKSATPEESRASPVTVMEAYFVYSNGTAITSNDVVRMMSSPEHYPILASHGLIYIGDVPTIEAAEDSVKYILVGMVAGLIIVLTVLTTSLLCTRRTFKRKLKAAKAMNSAAMVTSNSQQKSGPVVPGTNKYTMDGANPVLNLNIDTTLVLDMDQESSDVDKISLNSMDYPDDMTFGGTEVKQNIMFQEEDEDEDRHSGPPAYNEPLGEALAHVQKKEKKEKKDKHLD